MQQINDAAQAGIHGDRIAVLLDIGADAVLHGDVPGVIGDVGDGDVAILKLLDGVAVDAHVGVIEIGEKADGALAFGNEAVALYEFDILGVRFWA